MCTLYPGWRWGSTKRYLNKRDKSKRVRDPADVTVADALEMFMTPDSFTAPLWEIVRGRAPDSLNISRSDLVPFMKVATCPPLSIP